MTPSPEWLSNEPHSLREWALIRATSGLPANLFYSTGIPVCILILKKCKKPWSWSYPETVNT